MLIIYPMYGNWENIEVGWISPVFVFHYKVWGSIRKILFHYFTSLISLTATTIKHCPMLHWLQLASQIKRELWKVSNSTLDSKHCTGSSSSTGQHFAMFVQSFQFFVMCSHETGSVQTHMRCRSAHQVTSTPPPNVHVHALKVVWQHFEPQRLGICL